MTTTPDPGPPRPSLAREAAAGFKEGLVEETRAWLRWAGAGAILGALTLGILGFWQFGFIGLAIGAPLGLVVGAIGAWMFYLWATSLF